MRIIEAFVEELELESMGFDGVTPSTTGRPSYHPAVLLKIYIYGYLNRIQSSRRLERQCQRNVELMWLTGRLAPDFKTIADFRRDNGTGIRNVCRRFVVLCRDLKLFSQALVAIDGSKFKASNTRDRNFTNGKNDKRQQQIEESIQRYLSALETAGRFDRANFIYIARDDEYLCPAGQRAIHRFTREEHGMQLHRYWSSACPRCAIKSQCTPGDYRRITRWEHESVREAA